MHLFIENEKSYISSCMLLTCMCCYISSCMLLTCAVTSAHVCYSRVRATKWVSFITSYNHAWSYLVSYCNILVVTASIISQWNFISDRIVSTTLWMINNMPTNFYCIRSDEKRIYISFCINCYLLASALTVTY